MCIPQIQTYKTLIFPAKISTIMLLNKRKIVNKFAETKRDVTKNKTIKDGGISPSTI